MQLDPARGLVIRRDGYLKARFLESLVKILPGNQIAEIRLELSEGPRYRFAPLVIEGMSDYPDDFYRQWQAFDTGDYFSQTKLLKFYRAVQESGLFESVSIEAIPDKAGGNRVPVILSVKPYPPYSLTATLGYATDFGLRLRLDLKRHNVFGTGHTFTSDIVVDTRQQFLKGNYAIPVTDRANRAYTVFSTLQNRFLPDDEQRLFNLGFGYDASFDRKGEYNSGAAYNFEEFTDQAFTLSAKARHFKPGNIIKDLDGDLSFSLDAKGSIQPLTLDTRLKFEPGSSLKSEALQGDLTFNLSRNGLARGTGGLSWGDSRIALQSEDKTLNIRFNRISPRFLVDDLNAELSGSTRLVFEADTIRMDLELSTPEIRYRDFLGRNLAATVQGDTTRLEDLAIRLRIDSIDPNAGQARIEGLELSGTPSRHQLTTNIIISGDTQVNAATSGAYSSPVYRGTLDTLSIATERYKQFGLAQAAQFEAGPKKISLGPLILQSLPATPRPERLELDLMLDLDRFRLHTKGRLDDFPLQWLGDVGPEGTLRDCRNPEAKDGKPELHPCILDVGTPWRQE